MKCKYPGKACPYRIGNGSCGFTCPIHGCQYRVYDRLKDREKCKIYTCIHDALSYNSRCPYKEQLRKILVVDWFAKRLIDTFAEKITVKNMLVSLIHICRNNIDCVADYLSIIIEAYGYMLDDILCD